VAELSAEKTVEGNYEVHPGGVEEVVADKGCHSNDVAVGLQEMGVRSYIAEPDRGPRNWNGKENARGIKNVHKKFLIQAAACNLALLMRSMYGAGKPKAAYDRAVGAILAILAS
jgi:hypothetical protein